MTVWLLLVVIAQFFNAIVAVVDKHIVSSPIIGRPSLYAFYVSLLSALSILVFFLGDIPIPLEGVALPSFANVHLPNPTVLAISVLAGLFFFGALTSLFAALKRGMASDVIPVTGAASALSTLLFASFFLHTQLTTNFVWGFVLLILGTLILSGYRFWHKTIVFSVAAGLFFGAHFVSLKILFAETNFDDAFFWSRVGIVVIALLFFFLPSIRHHCFRGGKQAGKKIWALILGNKVLAGVASIMLLKAIELGDVSIVQALGSLQFVYILGFTVFFSRDMPHLCGGRCTSRQLGRKAVAVVIILIGFMILFL